MRLGIRLKRGKWHVAMPLYDLRVCPLCGTLVQGWPGQWQHDEYWHAPDEDEYEDPGGYIVGTAMAPADVKRNSDDDGYFGE